MSTFNYGCQLSEYCFLDETFTPPFEVLGSGGLVSAPKTTKAHAPARPVGMLFPSGLCLLSSKRRNSLVVSKMLARREVNFREVNQF